MTQTFPTAAATVVRSPAPWEPVPPAWVSELLQATPLHEVPVRSDLLSVLVGASPGLLQVRASFAGAKGMDILTFQQSVVDAYRAVFDQLRPDGPCHPVRVWAFVPEIHAEMGPALDRYMAFNAGRLAAYSSFYGGREAFPRALPTASAVGIRGERLVLHCLVAESPGIPVENPRQIPAYRYSRKYGPMPPCFARATRVTSGAEATPLLLVGGTASICGEDSMHVGDLNAQIDETFRNLASLVRSACGADASGADDSWAWLERFRELRVYCPRPEDGDAVLARVLKPFTGLRRVELLQAELCRRELLVEIEGLAEAPLSPA